MRALPDPIITDQARRWLTRARRSAALASWSLVMDSEDGAAFVTDRRRQVIISAAQELDGRTWAHVSVSKSAYEVPSYADLRRLHEVLMPDLVAYQLFVPRAQHVNIHGGVLHLWACLDGPVTPDFTRGSGSI